MANKREPNDSLRALIAEANWTFGRLARAVNAAGGEIGLTLQYDRTSVSHWLAGVRPRDPVPRLLAEVLSRRLGRTVIPVTAGFPGGDLTANDPVVYDAAPIDPTANDSAPNDAGPPGDELPAAARLAEVAGRDAHPVHRVGLRRSPYSTSVRFAPHWTGVAPPGADRTGERAGSMEVDTLRAAVKTFAKGLDRHGGGHARTTLAVYLADDVVPWLRRPADDRIHRALLSHSAYLVFVQARLHDDCALHGAAQHYYAAALGLADEAGDRRAWAVVLRGMSSQALDLNHRRIALDHGETAWDMLPSHAPPSVRSFVAAQLAVARASVGRRTAALAALGEADRTAASDTGDDPFDSYPRAALEFQRARTLHRLGDLAGATAALDTAARQRSPGDRRGIALTHALGAQLLLRAGHVDEATASWRSFLSAKQGLQSPGVDHTARALRRSFGPYCHHTAVSALLSGPARP